MTDFATDKREHYPSSQAEQILPGSVVGETVEQYTAGKQAANGTPVEGTVADATGTVAGGTAGKVDNVLTEHEMIDAFGKNPATGNDQVSTLSGQEGSTASTGQGQKVTTPSTHIVDWGTTSFADAMKSAAGKNVPVGQLIRDHLQWAHENGVMPDYWTINEIVNKPDDISLSADDMEKARKKAERKERFDKIGNFLLHLGNAIGNVASGGYGAVKLEEPVQWTERQRLLKEKAEQQRKLNNQSVWAMMQKERAEQRANEINQQKLKNETHRLDISEAEQKRKEYFDNFKIKIAYDKFDYQKEKDALDRKLKEREITAKEHALAVQALNAATNSFNAHNPIQEIKVTENSLTGKKETTTTKRTRGGTSGNNGGNSLGIGVSENGGGNSNSLGIGVGKKK